MPPIPKHLLGPRHRVIHGDCLEVLPTLPASSVDAVICDPPYPCIKRQYGYWTEAEWFALMDVVVPECRRVLKPTGSAVFILQPNSERLGRMRTWLLEFTLKWAREWGWVQDAYWWNITAIPEAHAIQGKLMRPSVKVCVWLGGSNCYRDQESVLWSESARNVQLRATERFDRRITFPSGHGRNPNARQTSADRGGVTPFNVLPAGSGRMGGEAGHSAATPMNVARWWTRYICPPGGVVLDPFLGSGTTLLACHHEGRIGIGIERDASYCAIARKRLADAHLNVGGCHAPPFNGKGKKRG